MQLGVESGILVCRRMHWQVENGDAVGLDRAKNEVSDRLTCCRLINCLQLLDCLLKVVQTKVREICDLFLAKVLLEHLLSESLRLVRICKQYVA